MVYEYRDAHVMNIVFVCFLFINGTVNNFSVMLGRSHRFLGTYQSITPIHFSLNKSCPECKHCYNCLPLSYLAISDEKTTYMGSNKGKTKVSNMQKNENHVQPFKKYEQSIFNMLNV